MAGPIAYRGNEVWLIHHAFAATSLAGYLLWEPVHTSRGLRARLIRAGRQENRHRQRRKSLTSDVDYNHMEDRPQDHRDRQWGGAAYWGSRSQLRLPEGGTWAFYTEHHRHEGSCTKVHAHREDGAATWWHMHRAFDIGLV